MGPLLFTKEDLRATLDTTTRKMVTRLEKWDPDTLLNTPEHDIVEELVDEGSVQCPRLLRDRAWMPEPSEVVQTFMDFGREIKRRVPQLTLVVPFEGERQVFMLRATTYSYNPPRIAKLEDHDLWITVEGDLSDAAHARTLFDAQLDSIEKHLAWSRRQIEEHNQRIRGEVPELVSRRRAHLLATRNLQADIGFPIRRRPDAGTYTAPVKRRTLRPTRPSQRPTETFKPEPVLSDNDYEAALAVLQNSRNALERNPSTVEKLTEEQIRDLLLINLNAQFEGDAAGEVFNGYGKTDILIRVEDRNIFIGECKVWSGPKTIDEALQQLFDYLVWRDTKAAILLFIRNKDVTAVIRKAKEKVEAHPNFKRPGPSSADERCAFIMHAEGDPEREIYLSLLPFALRARQDTTA
jgi:hypothetical protein